MKTTTTTQVTHYEVQKKRRTTLLEEWRGYHKTLKRADVAMVEVPSRRMRRGVFAGWDGDRPTKNLDATVHEIPPATTTTVHRHSWDAIMFIESGFGWTEIDGQRIDWRPWPGLYQLRHRHGGEAWLYVISGTGHSEIDGVDYPWEAGDLVVVDHWTWHQHFNDSKERTARLVRVHNFRSTALWSSPGRPEPARPPWPAALPTRRHGSSARRSSSSISIPMPFRASCWARASGVSRGCSSGPCPTSPGEADRPSCSSQR
jgi:quercetin dioxygenase-like cupin family protein